MDQEAIVADETLGVLDPIANAGARRGRFGVPPRRIWSGVGADGTDRELPVGPGPAPEWCGSGAQRSIRRDRRSKQHYARTATRVSTLSLSRGETNAANRRAMANEAMWCRPAPDPSERGAAESASSDELCTSRDDDRASEPPPYGETRVERRSHGDLVRAVCVGKVECVGQVLDVQLDT